MRLYEFILLILGIASLVHYIYYSLFRYNNWIMFETGIYKEKEIVPILRIVEISIILVNAGIWLYKLLF